jgi:nucleotidyltransferase substrate binding protein (TIGR01987 family)
MSPERIKELFASFSDALSRLGESLQEDITLSSTIIDGTIQRFEFTVELAWKLLRLMLLREGIEANTPRAVLKEAYRAEWLTDGNGWIDMLDDRNQTSHLYDEKTSAAIYRKIKEFHFDRLCGLRKFAEKKIQVQP